MPLGVSGWDDKGAQGIVAPPPPGLSQGEEASLPSESANFLYCIPD